LFHRRDGAADKTHWWLSRNPRRRVPVKWPFLFLPERRSGFIWVSALA